MPVPQSSQHAPASACLRRLYGCLLVLLSSLAVADDFTPVGQPLPDFTLPSAHQGAGQRLLEQRGRPLLILVTDHCDDCGGQLMGWQMLTAGYALNDLQAWVVWTPHRDDQAPQLALPVLSAEGSGWRMPPQRPAVLLINRDGVLDHHLTGSLSRLQAQTEQILPGWLSGRPPVSQGQRGTR